jgi:RNA polymerase-binding transcription factor DksA
MNEQTLKEYKLKLEKEREALLNEIEHVERPQDFGADIDGGDEDSDKTEQMGNQLAISQDLKNRLGEIDVALSNIHSGKYGVCEECGGPIGEDVLNAAPESRLCKTCKA